MAGSTGHGWGYDLSLPATTDTTMVGSQLGSPPRSRPRLRSSTPGPAAREAAFARDPPSPVRGPEFDFTALTPHQLAALQLMRQAARDEERRSPNPPTAEHQVMNHSILKLCCTIACYSYRILYCLCY